MSEYTKDADAVGIESTALFGKFYVDGQWKVIKKKCSTCCYVKHFNKRADEPSNMGCDKPGWEGYTFENDMACGGVFYFPNSTADRAAVADTVKLIVGNSGNDK